MKPRYLLWKGAGLCLLAFSFAAAEPATETNGDAQQGHDPVRMVADMKRALEPERRSLREMEIVVRGPDGAEVRWSAKQARRDLEGGQGILTVLVAPESVRGFAWLAKRGVDGKERTWMYIPPVRRVREIVGIDRFQSFLGSEFALGDLASFDVEGRDYQHVGEEEVDGELAHKILERLPEPTPYARIETWISTKGHLPLMRKYFDRAGGLWKVATFSEVTVIDGVPTVLRAKIKDEQAGGESSLHVSAVRYDAEVSEKLFDPAELANTAAALK